MLEGEMEEKQILPDIQAGFRKGRSTVDNLYILNYVIERQIQEERGKLFTLFADMKAAYDMVDRKELIRVMKRKKIKQQIRKAVEDIYRETESTVLVNGGVVGRFWTTRGLRQGCPLSPALFSIYISDIEEYMVGGQVGGMVVGREKLMVLAYADDLVLVAKTEEEMLAMINRFREYVLKKKLILNVNKSKVMVFKKGGRNKRYRWKWDKEDIETVKEWKYLGLNLCRNNSRSGQMRAIVKKATVVLKRMWSIGEGKFWGDYKTRMMLFDRVLRGLILYGAEIWGWERQHEIEKLQLRYLKWTLGLNRNTPTYIVLEETKREEIWIDAAKRAIRFEEKNRERNDKVLLRECMREMARREDQNKPRSKWEDSRKECYERAGISTKEVERKRTEGQRIEIETVNRLRDVQRQEQQGAIEKSRYNKRYERIQVTGIPAYLQRKWRGKQDLKIIARFRCGNEERANDFWKTEEERMCRKCNKQFEWVEHLIEGCIGERQSKWTRSSLLNESGAGIKEMRDIMRSRL